MEFLKYRSIDVFRFTLPGLLFILDFELLTKDTSIIDTIVNLISELNFKYAVAIGLLGYVIGFCVDPIGRCFRYKIAERIWKTPSRNQDGLNLTDSDRYVLTKQFSEGNYALIQVWDMLKGMAANFSVGTVVTTIIGSIKLFKLFNIPSSDSYEWIVLVVGSIIATFCFFFQTCNYEKFSVNDMTAAIKSLNLVEKGKTLPENKTT